MKFSFSDNNRKESLSSRFRKKRFAFFYKKYNRLKRPLQILDIGGTEQYWQMMGFEEKGVHVTLLNLEKQPVNMTGFSSIAGDATNLTGFTDQSIDIVYSNSVIEHLFTEENQRKMANEVRRVGKNYFVQTPNYFFLLEPHWVFPFFQFLPFRVKVWLTQHCALGHIGKIPDRRKAEQQVREIRLLTGKQMQALFPEAAIYEEKILFFTKSIVAYYFPEEGI